VDIYEILTVATLWTKEKWIKF